VLCTVVRLNLIHTTQINFCNGFKPNVETTKYAVCDLLGEETDPNVTIKTPKKDFGNLH